MPPLYFAKGSNDPLGERAKMNVKATALKVKATILELQKRFVPGELEALLTQINSEETVQPLLDPTYYIKNSDNLTVLKKEVEALQKVITP